MSDYVDLPTYDPEAVKPLREELTAVGVEELLTPEDVEAALGPDSGRVLLVINSVCGCAARNARPAVMQALQHEVIPDRYVSVFAGQEKRAVAAVREKLSAYEPSSPFLALFKDGEVVGVMERRHIEAVDFSSIVVELKRWFDDYCERPGPSVPAQVLDQFPILGECGSIVPTQM